MCFSFTARSSAHLNVWCCGCCVEPSRRCGWSAGGELRNVTATLLSHRCSTLRSGSCTCFRWSSPCSQKFLISVALYMCALHQQSSGDSDILNHLLSLVHMMSLLRPIATRGASIGPRSGCAGPIRGPYLSTNLRFPSRHRYTIPSGSSRWPSDLRSRSILQSYDRPSRRVEIR